MVTPAARRQGVKHLVAVNLALLHQARLEAARLVTRRLQLKLAFTGGQCLAAISRCGRCHSRIARAGRRPSDRQVRH